MSIEEKLNKQENNLLKILNKNLPNFVKMYDPKKNDLTKFYQILLEYESNIKENYNTEKPFVTKMSLAGAIITTITNPQENTSSILEYLDRTCSNILTNLNDKTKIKNIKKQILKHMLNFSSPTEDRFCTALAELSTLDYYINTKKYKFERCEATIPDRKTKADLHFSNGEENIYIEVINILEFDSSKVKNSNDLKTFLENRLYNKIINKLRAENEQKNKFTFLLQTVFWDIDQLKKYEEFLESYLNENRQLLKFVSLCPYRDEESHALVYKFETIDTRYNNINQISNN
ncbi:hypothetical protein EHQ68_12690 [Leptospira congkakensis]|uniref:Uncharacterized protein n=1 Tax=Leptospira congkakensis TaxID=2484932 RepID=A0A4Z1AFD8_9LEPT|nr:hypothetical protein [Leptospira congkakensis]TGL87394.1 hypothetical protein EHQ68_12690 [Leptospira congkakensis]TGL96961.1 hypothetical protein EHQ69_01635 [Leptospira congkakensis]TGL97814.1 hypothetical protein EHQ70_07290 [Leptospira congkakensis]